MTTYKHIFFDFDRTLWDFEANAAETLTEIHEQFNLERTYGVEIENFITSFSTLEYPTLDGLWVGKDH